MPTRKQRRRREKDFRHDVRVFEVDDEGNEVPLAELRVSEERQPKAKQKQPAKDARGRTIKEPPYPSWQRAFRRGGVMGAIMVAVFLFLLKGPVVQRLGISVFYAASFIPLTYWIDRTAYRSYLRRTGRQAEKKASA
jgi:hypothetical protein